MRLTEDQDRRLDLALMIVGAVGVFVNAFGQEALGWGFLPGGVIAIAIFGIGFGRRSEANKKKG